MLITSGEEIWQTNTYGKGAFQSLSSDVTHLLPALVLLARISHVVPTNWKGAGKWLFTYALKNTKGHRARWTHSTVPATQPFIIFPHLPCLLDSLNMPRACGTLLPTVHIPKNSQKILLVGYSVPSNAWPLFKTPATMLHFLKLPLTPLEKLAISSFVTFQHILHISIRPHNIWYLYYVFLTTLCIWAG